MEIENRFLENCVVIDIRDDHFAYPKTLLLKNHVMRLIEEGHHHFILNLSQVNMLDSFGIAVIISLLKICKGVQGTLALYGLNAQVIRLFELTRMDRVLDIWESETQALHQLKATAR